MARNPNAKDNLRPFPKGVSGNPSGRPKSLAKAIKEIPTEAQAEIYGVLHHALSLRNYAEAKAYINQTMEDKDLGRYGFIYQLALKSLTGPQGWYTLNSILDRLFGRPRVQAEIIRRREPRNYIVIGDAEVKDRQDKDFIIHVDTEDQAQMIMHIGDLDL